MKKILFLIPIFALLMGVYSCDDNDDCSKPHVLTQEEIDYMLEQDSLDSINRAQFADVIIDVSTTLNAGESYEGKAVDIDFSKVTDLFGLSVDEVAKGIEDGTVTPFVYVFNGSSYSENTSSPTASGLWGYWVDKTGAPCNWGADGCAAYSEWYGSSDEETGEEGEPNIMRVGQFPDALSEGKVITMIPALKYQGKTAAVKITITIGPAVEEE